jgi:ribosome assembly protein 1
LPLPAEATKLLETNLDLIKELDRQNERENSSSGNAGTLSESALINVENLKSKLSEIFDQSRHPELHGAVDRIWSFGPRRCGPNVLVMMSDVELKSIW